MEGGASHGMASRTPAPRREREGRRRRRRRESGKASSTEREEGAADGGREGHRRRGERRAPPTGGGGRGRRPPSTRREEDDAVGLVAAPASAGTPAAPHLDPRPAEIAGYDDPPPPPGSTLPGAHQPRRYSIRAARSSPATLLPEERGERRWDEAAERGREGERGADGGWQGERRRGRGAPAKEEVGVRTGKG